ncbi:MAG: hypothetical protein GY926_23255 [bacterium]|nr:hypothetical protein [bacterium]MCP4968140.1 hypothetical protein [bacterium]
MTHFHDPVLEFEERSDAIRDVESAALVVEQAKLDLKQADEGWNVDSLCGARFSPDGYLRTSL